MKKCLNSNGDWCFFALVAGFCVAVFATVVVLFATGLDVLT